MAVSVDAVIVAMVFWALSGLWMWWEMRATRLWGAACAVTGVGYFHLLRPDDMTFLHFVRRAHLYMGLFLLPWVVMFGVSSIPINHPSPEPGQLDTARRTHFDAPAPAAGRQSPAARPRDDERAPASGAAITFIA